MANTTSPVSEFTSPLDRPAERITKKPFGKYITPKTSPVQPERFTGYHTGVDFETFPNEANVDVPVAAFCTGTVRARQRVSGYGGVLVQQCTVSGEQATVLYGHLNLDSITAAVGDTLQNGKFVGNLGQGFSTQTDGERKHLHLSIHRGTAIEWRGYVQTEAELSGWIDPQPLLPQ